MAFPRPSIFTTARRKASHDTALVTEEQETLRTATPSTDSAIETLAAVGTEAYVMRVDVKGSNSAHVSEGLPRTSIETLRDSLERESPDSCAMFVVASEAIVPSEHDAVVDSTRHTSPSISE